MQVSSDIPPVLRVRLEAPLHRALVELAELRFLTMSGLIRSLVLREALDAGMTITIKSKLARNAGAADAAAIEEKTHG